MTDYLTYIYSRASIERKLLLALPFIAAAVGVFFDPWTALQRGLIGIVLLLAYGLGVHDEVTRVKAEEENWQGNLAREVQELYETGRWLQTPRGERLHFFLPGHNNPICGSRAGRGPERGAGGYCFPECDHCHRAMP